MKTKIPTNPEQRWEWIKFRLRCTGSSLYALGRELGVSGSAVQNAKYNPYPRMERAIARKLETTPEAIWPERWSQNGSPVRERPNTGERKKIIGHKPTESNAIAHCQIARSA